VGMIIEWPYDYTVRRDMDRSGDTVRIVFVPRARYNGRRAAEVPSGSAVNYYLARGFRAYDGVIFDWIPECVEGVPKADDWKRLLTEAWEHIPDELKREFLAEVSGDGPEEKPKPEQPVEKPNPATTQSKRPRGRPRKTAGK